MSAFGGIRRQPAVGQINLAIERHLHDVSRAPEGHDTWEWLHTTDWPNGICPYCDPETAAAAATLAQDLLSA